MILTYKKVTLKLRHPFGISRHISSERKSILITIKESSSEVIGYGEVTPYIYYNQTEKNALTALNKCKSYLKYQHLPTSYLEYKKLYFEIIKIITDNEQFNISDPTNEDLLTNDNLFPMEYNHIISALDSALLDAWAKSSNISLINLIDKFFISNNSVLKMYSESTENKRSLPLTSFTIGLDNIDKMANKVLEAKNFKILKIKLGKSLKNDQEIINKVRTLTNLPIRVDANGGWDINTAINMANFLENQNIEFIEQPFKRNNHHDFLKLKQNSPLPIIIDESLVNYSDIEKFEDRIDGINVKLSKCGGISRTIKIIEKARKHNLKVMLGCMIETSIGISNGCSISHLLDFADLDGNLLITNDPFVGQGNFKVIDGQITIINDKPGLNLEYKIDK
jgi:L-alanine-DL-glutamate epimerase-like enolase superfamily enzyme